MSWIKFMRSEETDWIIRKNHHAFVVLAVIARRAKRTNKLPNNFEIGEALIGDYKSYSMTRQNLRSALEWLKRNHLITTKSTNKGTIAKLIDTSILDINIDEDNHQNDTESTTNQPATNHQVTTNKNDKKVKNEKKKEKDMYLEYVFLTKKEYEKLLEDFGKGNLDKMLDKLDGYIGQNPKQNVKRYTDHNRVLRGWVAEHYKLKGPNSGKDKHFTPSDDPSICRACHKAPKDKFLVDGRCKKCAGWQ